LSIIVVPVVAFDDLTEGDPFEKGEDLKEGINEGGGGESGDPQGGESGDPQGGESGDQGNKKSKWEGSEGEKTLHKAIGILCGWVAKIGLFVAFYGVIKLGLAFVQEDANAKIVGLTAMISGIMVWSIAMSVNMFF
ncbi:MAG: hypothetical protein PHX01_05910, partial [Clostridia bacterium]|nr:hypothetical protein [Clostridia bacterium]